jgi:hypothetical protein
VYVGNTRSSDGLTIITSSVGILLFPALNPHPLDGMNIGITSMKILLVNTLGTISWRYAIGGGVVVGRFDIL